MHILLYHFYSRTPNPVYQEVANNLRQLGHTVWLGSRDEDDNLAWHDGKQIIDVILGPYSKNPSTSVAGKLQENLGFLSYIMRVRAFIRQVAPDVVQANINNLGWLLPLGGPAKTAFMYDVRQINEAVDSSWKQRLNEKRTILNMRLCARFLYDHTFFCHKEAARKVLGENWAKYSSSIPVGIDHQFLSVPTTDEASNIAPEDLSPVRFVYIGTLSRLRSLEKLLWAASTASQSNRKMRLDLIGPDTSGGYYQKLIQELDIGNMVSIKPPVAYEQVPQTLLSYDVGLAYVPDRPTWHYQPTIKVLEYRALGMPIISTDVATHREIVEHNKNGLLVADTPEALADGMLRYLDDGQFLSECQTNARAMRRGTTWLEVAQMYEEAYQRFATAQAP
ncbi:MAG: glycosyltransferase family 4 protein [Chloroflexota bacterium]